LNAPAPASVGTFLMTPEQHRRRAERLRQSNPELAKHHENLAKAIEKRLRDNSPLRN
jgi:hypothetical protein